MNAQIFCLGFVGIEGILPSGEVGFNRVYVELETGGGNLEASGTDCDGSIIIIHAKVAVRGDKDIIGVDVVEDGRKDVELQP